MHKDQIVSDKYEFIVYYIKQAEDKTTLVLERQCGGGRNEAKSES